MKLGAISTVLYHLSFDEAARRMHELGLDCIEIGAGGFFPKTHCHPGELLQDPGALSRFQDTLGDNELELSAFCMHGDCLHPDPAIADQWHQDFVEACQLAEKIGLRRFTLLSGLPEAKEGDQTPNFIMYFYPAYYLELSKWQWEQRCIPFWKEHGKIAADHGVDLCFEMHAGNLVYNVEELLRLRNAIGPVVCCNLDPSHLFWQGMDVIDVVLTLGPMIKHTHAKDSALVERNARLNGVMDAKDMQHVAERSWLFRTVGYGHAEDFWRNYASALRQVGYDDVMSIEHEDPLIQSQEGFELAVRFLKTVLFKEDRAKLWYE